MRRPAATRHGRARPGLGSTPPDLLPTRPRDLFGGRMVGATEVHHELTEIGPVGSRRVPTTRPGPRLELRLPDGTASASTARSQFLLEPVDRASAVAGAAIERAVRDTAPATSTTTRRKCNSHRLTKRLPMRTDRSSQRGCLWRGRARPLVDLPTYAGRACTATLERVDPSRGAGIDPTRRGTGTVTRRARDSRSRKLIGAAC